MIYRFPESRESERANREQQVSRFGQQVVTFRSFGVQHPLQVGISGFKRLILNLANCAIEKQPWVPRVKREPFRSIGNS